MMNPNIGIVIGSLRMGGAERVMIRLANGFVANGQSCSLIVLDDSGPLKKEIHPGVRLVSLNASRARNGIVNFRNYLRKNEVDVLIISQTHIQLMCLLAIKWEGWKGKVILNEHSLFTFNNKKGLNKSLAKYLFRRADAIVAVSKAVGDDFKKHFHIHSNVEVIHNATFTEEILKLKEEKADDNFSLPVILFVGRLVSGKNIRLLIDAFSLVLKKKEARLMLLGDGERRNELIKYAVSKGVESHVVFKGNVSNPYAYMNRCAVLVQTSTYEGLPTVLIEGLACCCNIVCVDGAGGAREVLTDKSLGTFVSSNEVELSNAILASMQDKSNCELKLNRAKEFGVEHAVKNYLSLINRMM